MSPFEPTDVAVKLRFAVCLLSASVRSVQAAVETNLKPCEVCGTHNPESARFCKSCGASLRPPPGCPSCGTTVPSSARFCPGCGAKLVGARAAAGLDPSPVAPPMRIEAPTVGPDPLAEARAEIERATRVKPRASGSSIVANLLLAAALLVAMLVVIKKMNEGAPKELSPFEAPPPSTAMQRPAEPPASPQSRSAQGAPADPSPVASVGAAIRGRLVVGSDLGEVPSGTLFLSVRPRGAPDRGPPVAAKRFANPRFPLEFEVGPGDVMLQGMPFEGPFDLWARLDTDGDPLTRSPGDLRTATPTPAAPGDEGVEVVLGERLR